MVRKQSLARAVAVLAIGGVLTAGFAISPSFGAANVTKKKVKKIAMKQANKVFNQNIGPATAGLLGNDLEIVTVHSEFNSTESKNATAECPAGKVLVSSGVGIRGDAVSEVDDDALAAQDIVPSANSVTVTGVEAGDADYGGQWRVTAYAVCATA